MSAGGAREARYARYYGGVACAAVVYALGLPLLCLRLVYRYKEHGEDGDRVVDKALGWLCPSHETALHPPLQYK